MVRLVIKSPKSENLKTTKRGCAFRRQTRAIRIVGEARDDVEMEMARPRRASVFASASQGRCVERSHGPLVRRAQAHVSASVRGHSNLARAVVEPQLGIALAEAHCAGTLHKTPKAERGQHAFVGLGARHQIMNGKGHMVDH
jgi:hypothetical protein